MDETKAREAICRFGRSLFERGLTPGSSGNISVRCGDGFLVTPTNASLGFLDPAKLARLDADGRLVSGDAPEMWNFEHPERVRSLHRRFIEAGADIVLTNSFGGNRHRLKLHNAQDQVREINIAAAKNARAEADAAGRPVYVGGSVGPTGEIMEPVGAMSHDEAVKAFHDALDRDSSLVLSQWSVRSLEGSR